MMYQCKTVIHNVCVEWIDVEQSSPLLDVLAITPKDALQLSLAIISLWILAFCGGLIGRILLKGFFHD